MVLTGIGLEYVKIRESPRNLVPPTVSVNPHNYINVSKWCQIGIISVSMWYPKTYRTLRGGIILGTNRINTMVRNKRFPISLPPTYERLLILWAYCKGVSKTQLAQNILQARLEDNREEISKSLSENALLEGITVDELIDRILEDF